MGLFDGVLFKKTQNWIFEPLSAKQTPDGLQSANIEPDKYYLSVFLRSMRIVNVRKAFSRFYGTVHSHISVPHLDGTIEIDTVTTPDRLKDVPTDSVVDIVEFNHRLLGPVPYRGGDFVFQVGLFSIKGTDLAEPFLDVLQSMSTAAGVSYWNIAKPFVDPVKKGIELLVGAQGAAALEIGAHGTWPKPRTGYYLAMRAEKGTVAVNSLKVAPDFRLTDQSDTPYTDYPYLLLAVEADTTRPDWFTIPDIRAAYKALQEDVRQGNVKTADQTFQVFRRTALTSPDLLRPHATAIVGEVEETLRNTLPATAVGAASIHLPDLETLRPAFA